MKRALQAVALLAVFLLSCDDDTSTPTPPQPPKTVTETHQLRDVDYVKDKFFFISNPDAPVPARASTLNVYLTVTPADLLADPSIQRIPGWVMPDSLSDGQAIRDAVASLNADTMPTYSLRQNFRLLQRDVDYRVITNDGDSLTNGIELRDPVPNVALKSIGVTYTNVNGQAVGGTYASLGVIDHSTGLPSTADSLMLKMIKAPDPRRTGPFETTWRLMMRNVYDLGWKNINPDSFYVEIVDVLNTTRLNADTPEGSDIKYLQIFGLDNVDNRTLTGKRDGLIDPSRLDLSRGLLWFPDDHAFAPDPGDVTNWTYNQFAFTGQYQAQYNKSRDIYERLLNPAELLDAFQYIIKAAVIKRAP